MDECASRHAGAGLASRAAASITLGLAIVVATIVSGAAPASAHTASGPRPSNYRTTVTSISPRIPGITVQVVELGNKIELTNRTPVDVVVLGYNLEPYLRVGPRGLYENLRSPATYLNRTRTPTTDVPKIAQGTGASTAPRWHRVSGSDTAVWHDHRIHFMGTSPPLAVQQHPGSAYTIDPQWTVGFRHGSQTVRVQGQLRWVPGPSGWPWLPIVGALFVLGVVVARSRRRGFTIAAVVALVGIDAAHELSAESARAGTQLAKTVQFFGDNFVSIVVWLAAGFTIWGLWRRRVEALYGVLLVGVMVSLVSGATDLSYLWKSQLPTLGPDLVARAQVAALLGLGLGLAVGALLALRRSSPRLPKREARDPRWLERLVAGLDDDTVAVACNRLDAGEVVPLALADVADRLAPVAGDLGSQALVFVVLAQDEIGSHVWSITAGALGSPALRVQRGRPAPARAELRITFPAFVSVLAGTLTLDAATAAGRLDIDGDRAFAAVVEPGGRLHPAAQGR